jgi:hypothetical protein
MALLLRGDAVCDAAPHDEQPYAYRHHGGAK